MMQDNRYQAIFQRSSLLLGAEGQARLAKAHVTICGLGGVGSYVAEMVVRAGVGHIRLVDFDRVTTSNINRQLFALHSTLGQLKADVAAARLADINPFCRCEVCRQRIDAENAVEFLVHTDYLADAIDDIPAKTALLRAAVVNKVPVISAMGAGRRIDPSLLAIADIRATSVCPLARIIRRELRRYGIEHGLRVVYSKEKPLPQAMISGEVQPLGSVSFVPSAMGALMASVIIRELAGFEI